MDIVDTVAPIPTLVVDDEAEAREGLLALLGADPEISVIGEARNGIQAIAELHSGRAELLFLDVQMPRLGGFGVLASVPAEALPVVVFVTAYDKYAVPAFRAHAQEYLLKPFSDERFVEALAYAKRQVRQRRVGRLGRQLAAALQPAGVPAAAESGPADRADRLVIPSGRGARVIRVGEIDWIEARNYCAKLHVGSRGYVIRETLTRLAARLDPSRFVRIHRSTIVNVDRLESLEPYFHGSCVIRLRDGTRLTVSRSRRAALQRVLGYWTAR